MPFRKTRELRMAFRTSISFSLLTLRNKISADFLLRQQPKENAAKMRSSGVPFLSLLFKMNLRLDILLGMVSLSLKCSRESKVLSNIWISFTPVILL